MPQRRRRADPYKPSRPLVAGAVVGCLLLSACAAALARGPGAAGGRGQGRDAEPIPAQMGAGVQAGSIEVGGSRRDYLIYVPDAVLAGEPAPLVMALHGGGGGARPFASRTGLLDMARRYGFILVAPEGVDGSWNNGSTTGRANRSGVDDVAFVAALADEVEATYPVEPGRLFATGFSAGGMMAYRLACDLPGRFGAIAVVAGTLTDGSCPSGQQVSVLHIHGSNDENVPLAGGTGQYTARATSYPSVASTLELFKGRNQCAGRAAVTRPSPDTSCEATACGDGEVVQLCTVEGGGHAWPGVEPGRRQRRAGVTASDFDATDYIAQFFLSH